MENQEKNLPVRYKEVSSIPLSSLDPEHPLIKAGFSPQLPTYFARLNEQLSLIDKLNEEQQLESMTVELTPDYQHPRLTIETQYKEKRQTRLTVRPDGTAMLTIVGKAPYEQLPDLIGVVDLLDMQDFVKQQFRGAEAGLSNVNKEKNEVFYVDFLSLTQKEFNNLEGKLYDLQVGHIPLASIAPYPVGSKKKCYISTFVYSGKAQDVEEALVGFINLLENNPPGKL
jgi:hypothetical protein